MLRHAQLCETDAFVSGLVQGIVYRIFQNPLIPPYPNCTLRKRGMQAIEPKYMECASESIPSMTRPLQGEKLEKNSDRRRQLRSSILNWGPMTMGSIGAL